jgi:hypothetical protein
MIIMSGPSRGVASGAAASGGGGGSSTDLLTLNPANDGVAGYRYWDYDTDYSGAFRLNSNLMSYSSYPTLILANGGSTLLVVSAYATVDDSYNVIGFNIAPITPSTSASLSALPLASVNVSAFNPVTSAPVTGDWGPFGARIQGGIEYNGRIMGNVYAYYDSGHDQNMSTFVLNNSASPGVSGERGFFAGTDLAYSCGWISELPDTLKGEFGGTHIFGMSTGNRRSIHDRFSIGPSLYIYDADASNSIVGSTPPSNGSAITLDQLIYYPLGPNGLTPEDNLDQPGQLWTNLSEAAFGFAVPNTDTYMVVGFSGGHNSGTNYLAGHHPNDPDDMNNWYWLFRLSDALKVKTGVISEPYQVECYESGPIVFRFEGSGSGLHVCAGAAFNSSTKLLYISLDRGDNSQGTESSLPLILTYDMTEIIG